MKHLLIFLFISFSLAGQKNTAEGRKYFSDTTNKSFIEAKDPYNTRTWVTGHSNLILVYGGEPWTRDDVYMFFKNAGKDWFREAYFSYDFISICFKSKTGEYCYDKDEAKELMSW